MAVELGRIKVPGPGEAQVYHREFAAAVAAATAKRLRQYPKKTRDSKAKDDGSTRRYFAYKLIKEELFSWEKARDLSMHGVAGLHTLYERRAVNRRLRKEFGIKGAICRLPDPDRDITIFDRQCPGFSGSRYYARNLERAHHWCEEALDVITGLKTKRPHFDFAYKWKADLYFAVIRGGAFWLFSIEYRKFLATQFRKEREDIIRFHQFAPRFFKEAA